MSNARGTFAANSADATFNIQSRAAPETPGGRRTFATITCRTCGQTDEAHLKDKNAGWARRIFKSRGWTVADRPGRHQCPACAQGPRGLAGRSAREVRQDGVRAIVMVAKHLGPADRRSLMGDTSLRNGVLELSRTLADDPNGDNVLQQIDTTLLEPDRMAEALSHLGHVTKHVDPPVVPEPEPAAQPRNRRGAGPREVEWKNTGRTPQALPISPKPLDLPAFLLLPKPARQFKRKLRGYRYPSDAAYVARAYLRAYGVPDPQIGRDFIVWAEGGEIGWALTPADAAPPPEPTIPTVEPVTTPEEPPMPPTIAAAPPSRPTRDKLLAIHEKLNAVYITDGAGRYTGTWSDAKVAADLDVPPAWVIEERSRVYGEGTDNEAVNIALDKWRRDMTNRMAKATERQAKAIEELLTVNTEIEAIKTSLSTGPKEG